MLVVACAGIDGTTPFPGAAALLPVGAAVLLILGGMTAPQPLPQRALCLAPVRFVGRISYSIYLWHWPLIVFAVALFPAAMDEVGPRVVLFGLVLAVSALSYYLVEQPGRRISLTHSRRLGGLALGAGALVVLVVGSLGLASTQSRAAAAVNRPAASAVPVAIAGTGVVGYGRNPAARARAADRYASALRAWRRRLVDGLAVHTLPASLQPLPDHLTHHEPPCNRNGPGECVAGDPNAERVAVLFGDSHAGMFEPTLEAVLGSSGWRLHVFTLGYCGWAGTVEPDANIPASDCARSQATALARIQALRPDLLVLSEDNAIEPGRSEVDVSERLSTLARLAGRVVVLGNTPATPPFDRCLSGSDDVSACSADVPATYAAEGDVVRKLATRHRVTYVDTAPWFCVAFDDSSLRCPAIVGETPVWRDGDHVTDHLALEVAPLLHASLEAAGVATAG